jgi:hypothetical protein
MAKYTINIAQATGRFSRYDGKDHPEYAHYCKIEIDVFPEQKAIDMLKDCRKRFPDTEGFKVDMLRWETVGYRVEEK